MTARNEPSNVRRHTRALRHLAAALVVTGTLSGCAFTYIPLVPPAEPLPTWLEARSREGLVLAEGTLALEVNLEGLEEEGWLAVQWFGPANRQRSSESAWVVPGEGRSVRFFLPGDVDVTSGRWRAVVSFGPRVLRQFSIEIPSRDEVPAVAPDEQPDEVPEESTGDEA